MAGPELAVMAIGSKVMGSVSGARAANAQEAQRNQAALDQFNQQQYNAEAQVIQSNMRGRMRAASVARQNRLLERNSLRELFTNAESLSIEQRNRRSDLITKSNENSEMIQTRAMQSNIQTESAMIDRIANLQTAELSKAMGDTDRQFSIQRQNLTEQRKKALASRGDETFVAQRFYRGTQGNFYDNSSARNTGALISGIGSAAGAAHGFFYEPDKG